MKKALILILAVCFMLTGCSDVDGEAGSDFTDMESHGGRFEQPAETEEIVIEISTAQDLLLLSQTYGQDAADITDVKYVLTNDIDMAGIQGFVPVANPDGYSGDLNIQGFNSTFDGQGYTIKNLTIDYNGDSEGKNGNIGAGLFGVVGENAVIKNVNIENITIDSIGKNAFYNSTSGSLAGYFAGKAENCHVTGRISAVETSGGFVGRITGKAEIINCTADVDISGCWYTGGFLGYADQSEKDIYIKNCASFGSVTAYIPSVYHEEIRDVGGFAGYCTDGVFENCHARTELIVRNTALSVGSFISQTINGQFINCTYNPAYTGNWNLIYWIDFVKCNGDYTPYSFTADTTKTIEDYILPSGTDTTE